MIWGVFGVHFYMHSAHTFVNVSFSVGFRSFELCYCCSFCMVASMPMHITLLLLHSNRSTLARIININNNKPIWARFKTAKVLNAYYICGCSFILVVVAIIIIVNEFVCLNHFFVAFPSLWISNTDVESVSFGNDCSGGEEKKRNPGKLNKHNNITD